MNIAEIISPIVSLVSENKTTIMTAVGVGGLIFSGVHAAVKSTPRALQIIENADGIVPYLMFNQAIYSEKKITRAVNVFSELLDRLLQDSSGQSGTVSSLMP